MNTVNPWARNSIYCVEERERRVNNAFCGIETAIRRDACSWWILTNLGNPAYQNGGDVTLQNNQQQIWTLYEVPLENV
ncbi:hypothetical protein CEXT_382851 [Caerostris extrusa]|uniref:Uncharacterized protein n=1 Tax=Caerostris extrusa TaxID=172846 RepID=A0AAV4M774_CAEEX|nr:hypothetical protein CEXT_382851 [Caerostris extrusa]